MQIQRQLQIMSGLLQVQYGSYLPKTGTEESSLVRICGRYAYRYKMSTTAGKKLSVVNSPIHTCVCVCMYAYYVYLCMQTFIYMNARDACMCVGGGGGGLRWVSLEEIN